MTTLNRYAGRNANHNEFDYRFRREQSPAMRNRQWERTPPVRSLLSIGGIANLIGDGFRFVARKAWRLVDAEAG